MNRLTRFLIVCMVWLGVPLPIYALDSYTDNMASTTGWTESNSGTGADVSAVTEDGRSCLKFNSGTTSGGYAWLYKVMPVSGQNRIIKFSMKATSLDSNNANQYLQIGFRGNDAVADVLNLYGFTNKWYTTGTDYAGRYEIGTDLLTMNEWADWEFRVIAPTPATAVVSVWKNGVKVAEAQDSSMATANNFNRFQIYLGTNNTTTKTIFIQNLDIRSWGMNYLENCDDIADWTDADTGTGVSTQSSDLGFSSFKMTSGATAGAGNQAILRVITPQMTNCMILEAGIYNDAIGTRANGDDAVIDISRTDTARYQLNFASDGLYKRTGATTYTEIGTDLVTQDSLTIWRVKFCTVTNKASIWKNGVLVAENIDFVHASTGFVANRISIFQNGTTTTNRLTYFDYIRLYSEDGQLIQTIIE